VTVVDGGNLALSRPLLCSLGVDAQQGGSLVNVEQGLKLG